MQVYSRVRGAPQKFEVQETAEKCLDWCNLLVYNHGDFEEQADEVIRLPEYAQEVISLWLALAQKQTWPKWSKSQAETLELKISEAGGPAGLGTLFLSVLVDPSNVVLLFWGLHPSVCHCTSARAAVPDRASSATVTMSTAMLRL